MPKRVSPVTHANCRFAGTPMHLHVGVWFKDKTELDSLISALVELRDTRDDDFDHVHLHHCAMAPCKSSDGAEVIFYRSGRSVDEIEASQINKARAWLRDTISNMK
jgi:hypothetical protein